MNASDLCPPVTLPSHARAMAGRFVPESDLDQLEVFHGGHINHSYLLSCRGSTAQRYLLQRINGTVFPRPAEIMENIHRVSQHVVARLRADGVPDLGRRFLNLVPTVDGAPFCRGPEGNIWRLYDFIEGATMVESAQNPQQAHAAGLAFGEFQSLLADLPGPPLHETIVDFHHTPRRLQDLAAAVDADPRQRVAAARAEIDFALGLHATAGRVQELLDCGALPTRTVHNDAKMSNVLLDRVSGEGLCVIDLDTVMPGSPLFDFGDMVRTMVVDTAEDETCLQRIQVRPDMFHGLVHGYLARAHTLLNRRERELLVFSGILITLETGVRFLTDFLLGDTYFHIDRPQHNLDRCRSQFQLVRSLQDCEGQLHDLAGAATAAAACGS